MPRARNIKPGFFENEHLGNLNGDTRLLFAALWTLADKQGVVECRIAKIRTYAFRYRLDITDEIVHRELTVLTRLDKGRMLSRVTHEGNDYLLIHNFVKHASPHHTEKRGDYPDFHVLKLLINNDDEEITVNSRKRNGENPPESLILNPESLILNPESVQKEFECNFDNFWNLYGKIGNKQNALKAFNRIKGVDYETIIAGLGRYQNYCRAIKQEQRFIKHASSWLNSRGWEDEYGIAEQSITKSKHERAKEALGLSAKPEPLNVTPIDLF